MFDKVTHQIVTKSVTFRCPEDLLVEIDEFGKENYSSENSGYDRSKTLITILQLGLQTLSEGSVEHISKTSKTCKTIELEEIKSVLMGELISEVMVFVRQELIAVRQELDKKITTMGE
jgi:hypothetical protein